MKLITWNIRHGGGNRISSIIEVLKENSNANLMVLTEFRNNENGKEIREELHLLGFINQYNIETDSKKNSVLIASKTGMESTTFPELKDHHHRVIRVSSDNFVLYGCYFALGDKKKPVYEFLHKELDSNPDQKTVIVGDINTGKHYIDEKGATFKLSNLFEQFEEKNLIDAWRYVHKDKREYSWYSTSENGFRLDHFFVNEKLRPAINDCKYIHEYRERGISDHSMMILELNNK